MSVMSGSASRMTLGGLASRYGFELTPSCAEAVTVTSLVDDVDAVMPGSLYVPSGPVSMDKLERAVSRGAYAALVPKALRGAADRLSVPLLLGECSEPTLARMADELAGSPSKALAMFACYGSDADAVERNVQRLAEFLHMLGNPVGVICSSDTQSLSRYVTLQYPLNALDIQRILTVCLEDGASAVIIALNDRTVRRGSLSAVAMDVLGIDGLDNFDETALREAGQHACATYGCTIDDHGRVVARTAESDTLAHQSSIGYADEPWKPLSLSIAMSMAAGVRRANIKSALRVSRELS